MQAPAPRASTAGPQPTDPAAGAALVRLAVDAIRSRLTGRPFDGRIPAAPSLRRLGCSFVTLTANGALRGCIGSLEPVRPLYRDVLGNTLRAMRDPRLPPVGPDAWPGLGVHISVLSPSEPMPACEFEDLVRLLRPQVDGVIIAADGRRATFLPSVWRSLPDPADFLAALLAKGGWRGRRLPPGAHVRRYTVVEFHGECPREPLPAPSTVAASS
ncbi:MAG TPA: AmmeMemoRadiSam system protein A [Micromonosporaceae bacterium]|nr:AmmeMemoRadiSam system protein A [Micromonosporaceae bacterium]